MTEKSIPAPSSVYRTYRFPAVGLEKSDCISEVDRMHMREYAGSYYSAETELDAYLLEDGVTRFFCTDSEVYAQAGRKLYMLDSNVSKTGFNDLTRIVEHTDMAGTKSAIALSETRTYRLFNNVPSVVATNVGGTCICFFRERFFIGSGNRLYYSEPLYYDKMNDYSTQKSGYIDLIEDGKGKIVETVSFGDKLFLIRERGITEVTGYGDMLGFRLKEVPCGAGTVKEGSVANCGDKIYFVTDGGLFAFNGSTVSLVKNADLSRVDLAEPVYGAAVKGIYFASVLVDGLRIFYCYDGRSGNGRYISVENEAIAAHRDNLCFLWKGRLYYLGNRALPVDRERCHLFFTFRLPENIDGDSYLDWIEVKGAYTFDVAVTGESKTYRQTSSSKIRLPRPLRGKEFKVCIIPQNRMFRLDEIAFHIRSDGKWIST